MRADYSTFWSFALKDAIERTVEENFPREAHRWPLLRAFDFEGHVWKSTHLIIVLRDKLSGIPAGGAVKLFDEAGAPENPPIGATLKEWQDFLRRSLKVRPQDAVVIIPIVDRGPTVREDWEAWTEDERPLWRQQIEINVTQQFYHLKGFDVQGDFFLPPGYLFLADECERFFEDHKDHNRNVLIMTRFVKGNRLLEELDRELRRVLEDHGLHPHRADDKMYMTDRNLWNNVCVYMLCCKYGIAILEDRVANEFNPNVAIEYGFMRALNKPVLLFADLGFRNLRADIVGTLREEFDITNIRETTRSPIERWLASLGKSPIA